MDDLPQSPPDVKAAEAEAFVRGLFHYVLERRRVGEAEVQEWVAAVLGGLPPSEVVRRFGESAENAARRAAQRQGATKYPHGHFYSPVVDVAEVSARRERVFGRAAPAGLDLRPDQQLAELARLARYAAALPFDDAPGGRHRYHYGNSSYGFGDACIYWAMLATLRPRRLIEVGSGYTSALALDAIDALGLPTECTFIDPHPELLHRVCDPIDPRHNVVPQIVQDVDPQIVTELEPGDILFIDSSHVVKTGSDVLFELTELLPRLRPGVVVHFHDTFHPFEYPEGWVLGENHSWNELYFLHVFLLFNTQFEIRYFNDYVAKVHPEALRRLLPQPVAERLLINPGGGLWLMRR